MYMPFFNGFDAIISGITRPFLPNNFARFFGVYTPKFRLIILSQLCNFLPQEPEGWPEPEPGWP